MKSEICAMFLIRINKFEGVYFADSKKSCTFAKVMGKSYTASS
jgi:hypothetical protein